MRDHTSDGWEGGGHDDFGDDTVRFLIYGIFNYMGCLIHGPPEPPPGPPGPPPGPPGAPPGPPGAPPGPPGAPPGPLSGWF